ncbi:hypothetical protein Cni_G06143 [Canna indica]|uniref:NAC domain-containing protein n=1 Tax=Canna indica TaxID=4628 RepID=A0AAQ3Q5N8_9LILI|nr:hypothetical protein Cni_G06143 [Canna indica]
MERPSFVGHGMLKQLPPGFRFHPTDEELVVQYLRRKVYSCPLSASIIPEIDLGKFDPWDLPVCGGCEGVGYFFSRKEATNRKGNGSRWVARTGFWKATGKEKQVVASRCNQVVGTKKVMVFLQGKPSTRTDWIMHEYRLAGIAQRSNLAHSSMVPNGDWVLCRIFKKKRATKEDHGRAGTRYRGINFVDLMRQGDDDDDDDDNNDQSCVTELPDGSSDGEEASSAGMSSSPP